ncbi:MAG TPA: hypothetical protein VL337_09800 [Acidimicrobiales bacterium]|nr:hypothetical protein [Acidimicrobiales bacterium]
MTDLPPLPSLEVLLDAVRTQREQQLGHFESLDTKAGVVVGFSGAIAALAKDVDKIVAKAGVGMAVVAAALAVLSFWPRGQPVFALRPMRDSLLTADAKVTRLRLLDTEIAMAEEASGLIAQKARWLGLALVALLASVAFLVSGTLLS